MVIAIEQNLYGYEKLRASQRSRHGRARQISLETSRYRQGTNTALRFQSCTKSALTIMLMITILTVSNDHNDNDNNDHDHVNDNDFDS